MLMALGAPASAAPASSSKDGARDVATLIQSLSETGKDSGKAWSELTAEEQQNVTEALKAATPGGEVTSGIGRSGATNACRWVTVSRWYNNALGMRLFTYYERIDWCYNGSTITSVSRTRWGEVGAPFWEFKGHVGSTTSGGTGQWSYRAWTQGHYALCMPYVLCAQHKYPWIDITVRANGTYSYSTGG